MLRSKINVLSTGGVGGTSIAHNLGVVPDFVYLTPKSNDTFWVGWYNALYVGVFSTAAMNPCEIMAIKDHSLLK